MRIVNRAGRLGLLSGDGIVDVARASNDRFSAEPQHVFERWSEFCEWAGQVEEAGEPFEDSELRAPVPEPRQIFAIGLNYRDHAEEAGLDLPDSMVVFTKFQSSITGPLADVSVPAGSVDFEAELVVVIGKQGHRIDESDAWSHVAGLTVGQDLSEREMQLRPPSPQFNMGKSFPGFAPMGPALVTPEEFADPEDLEIGCTLNGVAMQKSRTGQMIFSITEIISRLSATVTLFPGDIIFTGTPAGVGFARDPKVLLGAGDELVTTVEGIGSITTRFVA